MLLITDRIGHSRLLEQTLALYGACSVVDVREAVSSRVQPARLIVSDVDISNRAAVEAIRSVLAAGAGRVPHLCLVRTQSLRGTVQANAIGATAILPADVAMPVLMDKIDEMLGLAMADDAPDRVSAQIRRDLVKASATLVDMFDAAAQGRSLSLDAINDSVDSMNRATENPDINSWLNVVWNHDNLTYQHCLLVAGLTAAFAHHLRFSQADRRLLTSAAMLHDIGKARIPLDILHKAGRLDACEMEMMRQHPTIGAQMLAQQGCFAPTVIDVVLSHHEYLDGSGYPHGLDAGAISDVVRMVTICDIYGALIERRPYRQALAPEAAFSILQDMGGKLDADLLGAFRQVLPAQGWTAQSQEAARASA